MWALVTGGGKRLGASICLDLAKMGYSVAIHYRTSRDQALEVAAACRKFGVNSEVIQGDFTTVEGVKTFADCYLDRFSNTSALINNVGDYLVSPLLETSIEDWLYLFQLNLNTPFILSQALVPSLLEQKGQILNIGVSGLKKDGAYTLAGAYMLAKESLWGLTRSLARELAPKSIRVNMISPGELDISVDHRTLPMHRSARCSEITRVIAFLLDPESSYITGQNIEVAGGFGL
jgi:3-oxoacyl-[acyl-carrier protein] reductase